MYGYIDARRFLSGTVLLGYMHQVSDRRGNRTYSLIAGQVQSTRSSVVKVWPALLEAARNEVHSAAVNIGVSAFEKLREEDAHDRYPERGYKTRLPSPPVERGRQPRHKQLHWVNARNATRAGNITNQAAASRQSMSD